MKDLIHKFLSDSITEEEKIELRIWLKNSKNKQKFKAQVRHTHAVDLLYSKVNETEAYKNVLSTIDNQNKVIPLYKRSFIKYAAVIVLFLSVGYFYVSQSNFGKTSTEISTANIKTGTDRATLTLEDGSSVALVSGEKYNSNTIEGDGEALVYKSQETPKSEIAYNYLTVPRGGQYIVTLSDGTKVWLNSESQLKYPVNFIEGEARETELVYGEAYFDVSPSFKHGGAKFKVLTNSQEIEVLGTEFNVKAYKNDELIYTTLIEGSIALSNADTNKILRPNQQAIVVNSKGEIEIDYIDVYNEISWKEGVFSFKDKPLKDIMSALTRWYNVEIIFRNKDLENELFGGVFDKSQEISEILNMIESTSNVTFKLEKGKIVIE